MNRPLRIGVVAERRYLAQAQPSGMIDALRRDSHDVTVIDPQVAAYRLDDDGWLEGLDVVVGRGRSVALMCLLGWAESRGRTLLDLAFAWLLAHPRVASVIAGATSPEQVRANAATAAWRLTPAERAEVDALAPAA